MAPRWDTRYRTCIASLNAEATNWSRRKKREYLQNTAVIWRDLSLRTLVLDDSDRFKFVEREPNVNNNSNNGGQQDGLLGGDDEVEQEIHGGVDIGGQLENEGEDSDSQEDFDSEGQQNNEGRQLGGDNDVEQDIYGGGDIGGHLGEGQLENEVEDSDSQEESDSGDNDLQQDNDVENNERQPGVDDEQQQENNNQNRVQPVRQPRRRVQQLNNQDAFQPIPQPVRQPRKSDRRRGQELRTLITAKLNEIKKKKTKLLADRSLVHLCAIVTVITEELPTRNFPLAFTELDVRAKKVMQNVFKIKAKPGSLINTIIQRKLKSFRLVDFCISTTSNRVYIYPVRCGSESAFNGLNDLESEMKDLQKQLRGLPKI